MIKTLGHCNSRAHAKARINHVQRRRVAKGVASDVSAVDCRSLSDSLLYSVERSSVRTSRAKHRRSHRKLRSIFRRFRFAVRNRCFDTSDFFYYLTDLHRAQLSAEADRAGPLAFYEIIYVETQVSVLIDQSVLNVRIELFKAYYLVCTQHELSRQICRERIWSRYLHDREAVLVSADGFLYVRI